MDVATLAPYAEKYQTILQSVRQDIRIRHIAAEDHFIKIYKKVIPDSAGAYIIHTPEDIIYIGKALSFRGRVWYHLKAPIQTGDDPQYFFYGSRFLLDNKIIKETRDKIKDGHFFIDYFEISDPDLADGLEVYLQSIYHAKEGRLPEGNKQFG